MNPPGGESAGWWIRQVVDPPVMSAPVMNPPVVNPSVTTFYSHRAAPIINLVTFHAALYSPERVLIENSPAKFIKDGTRAWLNLGLLGISHMVVAGFFLSMGAIITPMATEFEIDISTASLGVTLFPAVFSLTILPVNIIMEKNLMGPK